MSSTLVPVVAPETRATPRAAGTPHYRRVDRCRICGGREFAPVIDLGEQYLTGVFPPSAATTVTCGPLELVRCSSAGGCGLVQLQHSYDSGEMYGANYGYRSSLNASMVAHLRRKAESLMQLVQPAKGDLVVDIGSNDGTTLSFHPPGHARLVGIDPTGEKFRRYYRADIELVADFFSADVLAMATGGRKAKLITSIAMFYDLDDPVAFARHVADSLAPDGVWHFEQSYLPAMLDTTSYDTICHEHLEYYGLAQIEWILEHAGLRLIDVSTSAVNGGSFAITAAHAAAPYPPQTAAIDALRAREARLALGSDAPYAAFAARVVEHRRKLRDLLASLTAQGRTVLGYGASTKGNVVLQYCGIGPELLPAIADVNSDKFGCVTPGTHIPIVSEAEAHARRPDYLLVLPWHFRDNLVARERDYLARGGRMIFPLPAVEIVAG